MNRLLSFFFGLSAVAFIARTGVAQDLTTLRQEFRRSEFRPGDSCGNPEIGRAERQRSVWSGNGCRHRELGNPSHDQKNRCLVYAAVRVVRTARSRSCGLRVNAAPQRAPEIAAAAVRAVPNPWKEVRYQRGEPVPPMPPPAGTEPVSSVPLANNA